MDVDGGRGDLSDGGDVSLLHDPGAFCKSWSPSQVTPPPQCKAEGSPPECNAWIASSTPPSFPAIAECDSIKHVCIAIIAGSLNVHCNLGKPGDDYCSAFAEAWLQPGVAAHGLCLPDGEAPALCSFASCDEKDPSGQNGNSKRCDPSEVCVAHADGSLSCELPCWGP